MGRGNPSQLSHQKEAFIELLRKTEKGLDYEDTINQMKEDYGYKNLPTSRQLSTWAKTIDMISFEKIKCKLNGRTTKRMVYNIEDKNDC